MKNLSPILLIVLLFIAVPVALGINILLYAVFPIVPFVSMLICIVLATREIDSVSAFGWGLAGFLLGVLEVILFIFVQYFWPNLDHHKKIVYENLFNGLAISAMGLIILIFGSFLMYEELS